VLLEFPLNPLLSNFIIFLTWKIITFGRAHRKKKIFLRGKMMWRVL
jgi:hypothetical protein